MLSPLLKLIVTVLVPPPPLDRWSERGRGDRRRKMKEKGREGRGEHGSQREEGWDQRLTTGKDEHGFLHLSHHNSRSSPLTTPLSSSAS
jgi:hypothetical protein